MCEFISWIKGNDGYLYYLTDKDIFSSFGREKLAGHKHNDCLGHGAIRVYWNLKENEGENKEQRDFWEFDKLPAELAEKMKDFDNNCGESFERFMQNDDLRYIVEYAPDEWREKAKKILARK